MCVPTQQVPKFQNSEQRARKEKLEMPHNLLYMSHFYPPGACYGRNWHQHLNPKRCMETRSIVTFLSTTRSSLALYPPAFTHEPPVGILPCEDLTGSTAPENLRVLISYSCFWYLHWFPALWFTVGMNVLPPRSAP